MNADFPANCHKGRLPHDLQDFFFKKQAALKSFAALLILCLAACDSSSSSPTSPQITLTSVQTTGPFWSGTRSNVYTRNDGEDVTVQIWYPTSDEMGDTVRYDNLLDGDSWVDATPDCTASRPVVVFSHGNGGVRWQSAFNMHFLATHGFVVIAMGHPQNTFRDLDRNLFPEHTLQRPKDVKDTFDWLIQQGTTESNDLFGCINPEEGYAVMGHSFGGYTSFLASGATVELTQIEAACDEPSKLPAGSLLYGRLNQMPPQLAYMTPNLGCNYVVSMGC